MSVAATMPPSPLLGRRERLWPTLLASLVLHAAFVALVLWKRAPPPIDLNQKPIRATLVRLGEVRPKELLPRKPTAPAPAAEAPAPSAAPQPAPPVARPQALAAPSAKPQPRPAAPTSARPPSQRSAAGSLSGALRDVQQARPDEKVYGSPTGSAFGTSDEAEGDPYQAEVQQIIQDRYVLPTTISEQERLYLRAEVVVYIAPSGSISRYQFLKRSGNAVFDGALEAALRSARLPSPPPDMQRRYLAEGLALAFRADQK